VRTPPYARGTGLRTAVHAEWTKLRSVSGPLWLVLTTIALTTTVGLAAAAGVSCRAAGCQVDPARISLAGINLGQAVVAVLAVLAIAGEYSTGMVRVSLAAVPRRGTLLAAKALVVTAVVLVAGTVAVLGSVLAGRLILPDRGFTAGHGYPPLSLADGPVLRAAGGSVLYLALIALLSLGIATAVRDSAAAIGTVLGLLYLPPLAAALVGDADWSRRLQQISPMSAGLVIQDTTELRGLPIGPWAGLGVLAAWAAGALLVGAILLQRRDA
jgi:ABC-2 type transport system permease protein